MENTFQSDDIQLCAFLLTQNLRFIKVIEDYPRHFIFVMSDLDKCKKLKADFINGALAPAKQLFFQRENLIGEIRNKNQK